MEIWDGYFEDGTPAHTDLVRGEPIPAGLHHLVCEVLVRHTDGTYLLMQRDPAKPNYGGFWEATAGGSALKGEDAAACARRELLEETGIAAVSLRLIGRSTSHDTIYYNYLCVSDCIKTAVTLQAGETVAYKWVSGQEFAAFIHSGGMIPSQQAHYAAYFAEMGYSQEISMDCDCGFTQGNKWFRYRAAAIIIENGCVLLAGNEKAGYFYSVGGGVHLGETAEDAVRREVLEETGVAYEIERLAFIHENFFRDAGLDCHEVALYFLMKPRGTQQLDSHSTTQGVAEHMYWLPIGELDKYTAFPTFFREKLQNLSPGIEHIVTRE